MTIHNDPQQSDKSATIHNDSITIHNNQQRTKPPKTTNTKYFIPLTLFLEPLSARASQKTGNDCGLELIHQWIKNIKSLNVELF